LHGIAVGNIRPGIGLRLVNADHVAETENSLIELLQPHMGAATCEPLSRVKSVDFKRFIEALNRFFKLVLEETHSAERPHGPCTPFFALFPCTLVKMALSFNITKQTEQVRLRQGLLTSFLIVTNFLRNGLTKVLLCKLQGLSLASSHEEALYCLFSKLNFIEELKSANEAANALVEFTELKVEFHFEWEAQLEIILKFCL
jgi:hypothetical protein